MTPMTFAEAVAQIQVIRNQREAFLTLGAVLEKAAQAEQATAEIDAVLAKIREQTGDALSEQARVNALRSESASLMKQRDAFGVDVTRLHQEYVQLLADNQVAQEAATTLKAEITTLTTQRDQLQVAVDALRAAARNA